jgi:hypothetical protein
MKTSRLVLVPLITGCVAASPKPAQRAARADRVLEISASSYMPPGSYNEYVLREADGMVEAYAQDLLDPSKRTALAGTPRLVRFIDRVDSLITARAPGDTIRSDGLTWLCADGFRYGAWLTVGSTVRKVEAKSCGDNSPGLAARATILHGIVDSLAKLPRAR